MARELASKAEGTEGQIAERIAEAGLRVRRDKVALRFLDGVKAGVGPRLPADVSVVFTVTAPIKLPAQTCAALQQRLLDVGTQGWSTNLNSNEIRARSIQDTSAEAPRVLGLVHNPGTDARLLLDIAERSLREH